MKYEINSDQNTIEGQSRKSTILDPWLGCATHSFFFEKLWRHFERVFSLNI